jgi:hypothetical protein
MTTDDQDLDPDAHDCDEDLSVWEEHDEPVLTEPTGDHPLSEPLALVADVAERLQTWASDLSSALRRRGGRMTLEELEEGRKLNLRVTEATIVALYVGRHM